MKPVARLYFNPRFLFLFALGQLCLVLFSVSALAGGKTIKISDTAWYDPSLPIPVLHLEGSLADIARDHGKLTALQPDGKATFEYLSTLLEKHVRANPLAEKFPLLGDLVIWGIEKFVTSTIADHVPDAYESSFQAFAQAAGVSNQQILNAVMLPDSALWLLSAYKNPEGSPFPADFGCTSVIWNSKSDSALHGRNLDYSGVGLWDAKPLILHIIPKEGLAHVAITSLGVHATGITAFNEAGLTVAVHQLTTDDTDRFGAPVAVISAEIARTARSIDDAITIIKNFPRAGGWAYVLSQGIDRAVVESTASQLNVRRSSEQYFYQTNHAVSKLIEKDEIYTSPGGWIDSFERAERLRDFKISFNASKIRATPEKIAEILGDRRGVIGGGTLVRLDNIQSVIFDASRRRLWVATSVAAGEKDSAPAENTFVEYFWQDLRSPNRPTLTGATVKIQKEKYTFELRKILRQLLIRKNLNKQEFETQRTALLVRYVEESKNYASARHTGYWPGLFLYVWNAMKLNTEGTDYARLLSVLELALQDGDLNARNDFARHRLSMGLLFKARLLDLAGSHDKSLAIYEDAIKKAVFEQVRLAASKGMKSAYSTADARKIAIDWAGFDLFSL